MGEPLRWALAPAGATASSNRGPGTAGPLLANPLLPPHPTPWLRSGEPPVIKICDFGFAKTWSEEANMFTQIGWAGAGAGRAGKQPQSPRSVRLGMGQERAPTRASPLCRAVQHPRVHEPRADQQQERQGASAMRWRACRCSFLLHTTDLSSLGLPPSPARAPSPPMCQPCLPLSSTANAYPPPPTPPQTHTHTACAGADLVGRRTGPFTCRPDMDTGGGREAQSGCAGCMQCSPLHAQPFAGSSWQRGATHILQPRATYLQLLVLGATDQIRAHCGSEGGGNSGAGAAGCTPACSRRVASSTALLPSKDCWSADAPNPALVASCMRNVRKCN